MYVIAGMLVAYLIVLAINNVWDCLKGSA